MIMCSRWASSKSSRRASTAHGEPTVTALDSIEAGRWGRANLVDGFDSRHALPCPVRSRQPVPAMTCSTAEFRLERERAAAGRGR